MLRRLDIRTRRAVRNAHIAWSTLVLRVAPVLADRDTQDRVLFSLAIFVVGGLLGGMFE